MKNVGERKPFSGSSPRGRSTDNLISSSTKNVHLTEMKHQKIVDGASKVLFKKGYHLTTIREIAKACDMSMGQLYHYISSKDDILFLVHKHMQKIWYDHLESFGVEKIEDPRQKLLSVLGHTLEFMVENKKLIQFVYSESKHLDKKHLRVILEMDDQNVVGYYRRLLMDINKHKSLKEDLNLCANLIAYLNVFLALRGWNLKKIPRKTTIHFLIDFVMRGIGLTA
jgi:AcrR family transcriptional regulator